jgi:hypothetical protein
MFEHYFENHVQEFRKTRDSKRHSAHQSHGYPYLDEAISWLRTREGYQGLIETMRALVMPMLAAIVLLWLVLAGLDQGGFALLNSGGYLCMPTPMSQVKPLVQRMTGQFRSADVCWPSSWLVQEGERYRLTITIDTPSEWTDGGIRNGIGGPDFDRLPLHQRLLLSAGSLFSRHVGEPWFKPIARKTGSDEYPLNPSNLSSSHSNTTKLVAEFTARRNGELFLFVNDAVLPAPKAGQAFYLNNAGRATVTAEPVGESMTVRDK